MPGIAPQSDAVVDARRAVQKAFDLQFGGWLLMIVGVGCIGTGLARGRQPSAAMTAPAAG